jgi:hypothetical protein
VGGDSEVIEPGEDKFGNPLVKHALAFDHGLFLGVEGGCIILEMHDHRAGLGALIQNLGFAFVNAGSSAGHMQYPHQNPYPPF